MMDEGAKRRLVGAAVLVALAVIFVPMLLNDKEDDGLGEPIVIPDAPEFDAGYAGADDDAAVDTPAETTPALPIPEPPSGDLSQGPAGPAALPVPEPSAQAQSPSQTPSQSGSESRTQASREPKPAPAAARTTTAVVGPKPVPAGTAAWVVQVASLGSATSAQKLRDDLRGKGYHAFVEQARVNGKLYYRVRVGPETNRGRADDVAAKLQRETGNKPLVQSYQ
jgi:DedD protein